MLAHVYLCLRVWYLWPSQLFSRLRGGSCGGAERKADLQILLGLPRDNELAVCAA